MLGILPGIIGLIQATETVKLILGIGDSLVGRLVLYDAFAMKFRELKLRRNPECPVCGDHPTVTRLIDYHQFCGVPQASAAPAPVAAGTEIEPVEVKLKLDRGDKFFFLDVREPHEFKIASLPGTKLIPLGELGKRLAEVPQDTPIIVHCMSGGRSAKACDLLRQSEYS